MYISIYAHYLLPLPSLSVSLSHRTSPMQLLVESEYTPSQGRQTALKGRPQVS